ncbi:MAG: hypothetical protein Q8P51_07310 [Ignavibacteria bacterium]|nr:hypothetical protein [Ignavibacteria bacterium]
MGLPQNGTFYELAENVLKKLLETGLSDSEARVFIAEKLGMLDDRQWFGEIGLPLSGNTPRHRAIARFAVEKRLRAIVSLNWDTLLEAALESVGLADGSRSPRPWEVTAHRSVVVDSHLPRLASPHVFPVIKPHGCVRNIEQARRHSRATGITPPVIFKLTHSELANLPLPQTLVDKRVECYASECPLIAVGWKASESYLRKTIVETAQAVQRTEPDAFTLVSRSWYTDHDEISTAYGRAKANVFVEVGKPGQPTLDCLFQWLQARHALCRLIGVAPASQQSTLHQLLLQLDQPDCSQPILRWVDAWLPTWVRLCWRAGVMQGIDPHTNRNIESWEIPIMPRDVHVPLGSMTGDRRELQAAAKLLVLLGSHLSRFNFEMFPGGFWDPDPKSRCLFLLLPGWRRNGMNSLDLAALKPQVEAMHNWGFVQKIRLIWLDTADSAPIEAFQSQLGAQLRRLLPLAKFAAEDALAWVDLESLKGGTR